ncbi:hypothetical protein CLHUN_25310 [Ruminiclostridium hungatei]|uniref:Uncharacterized protein n=1 Tax=Ruminiclostridium hungatei TaxID=48256 RepID=A0A1V4SIJ5_RUMHU|nr:hypothetical protein [Ruminiclostridium hungatei]OPX43593.1 hypothetical protein CLHUN_25310 [Ruminiclostridium hungatei]
MKNFLKVLGLSLLDSAIIIILLICIVRIDTMAGIYIVYGVSAVLLPLLLLILYKRFFGRETLVVVPVSMILAAAYSLGVSLYSFYGTGSFSRMFKELMYFIYFLPSVIYCGVAWIIFAIIIKFSKEPRRREI